VAVVVNARSGSVPKAVVASVLTVHVLKAVVVETVRFVLAADRASRATTNNAHRGRAFEGSRTRDPEGPGHPPDL
jgi:hypothetical protein